ncbi:MAG: hypothetical protein ACKOU6_07975 [Planctomycetota bacterium]
MGAPQLRVFYGPHEDAPADIFADTLPLRSSVTLPLGDLLSLLVEALHNQRGWVDDFSDDEVTISSDLHEVLMAYQHHFGSPSA